MRFPKQSVAHHLPLKPLFLVDFILPSPSFNGWTDPLLGGLLTALSNMQFKSFGEAVHLYGPLQLMVCCKLLLPSIHLTSNCSGTGFPFLDSLSFISSSQLFILSFNFQSKSRPFRSTPTHLVSYQTSSTKPRRQTTVSLCFMDPFCGCVVGFLPTWMSMLFPAQSSGMVLRAMAPT